MSSWFCAGDICATTGIAATVKRTAINSHNHAELRQARFWPGRVKRDPGNILFSFGVVGA
jgi:hypothetical protein